MFVFLSDMARTFEVEPSNVTAYMGDVVMFPCKIDGIPRPSIVWMKDDHEITAPRANLVLHQEDGFLEIRSTQFTDFGRYRYLILLTIHKSNSDGWLSVINLYQP